MEHIYDAISPEYLICNDDFDRYVEISADKKIMLQKIIYKKEKYDHLAFAALLGSVRIFKFLLANQMCISRDTTINAIKGGNDEIIQILQQQETSFDWCLKSSIEYHNNEIALWLLENYKCDEIDARFCTEYFNTLALCYFVERGIDLEKKDRFGCTPFVNAAKNGHLPIAMHLINSGALLESEEFHGWNALNIAITYRSMDMIKYLISCHSNIKSKDHFGSTPLIRAADCGYLEIVECLIEKGANINASDSCGYTALISAAINGKGLIEKGANINQYDNDGFTPLMHAVQNSNIKVIKILLDNGADKDAVSKRGYTAMSLSSSEKVSQVLSQKQKFVIPFVKMTHEEIKASRGITPEDEKEDDKGESGVIYGLLSNWNPFV